jgi:hypothetical protein
VVVVKARSFSGVGEEMEREGDSMIVSGGGEGVCDNMRRLAGSTAAHDCLELEEGQTGHMGW